MVLAPTVQIASLGMADSLILMVMALVVFGPRRLPQIGRQIGKLMYEFRKASNDFKFQMEEELRNSEEADRRKKEEERLRALALAAPAPATVDSQVPALSPGAPETTEINASESATAAPETVEEGIPNTAAGYDNGPVASTQIANTQAADSAPTIRPPSKGEIIAAAQGWSFKQQQAKSAETTTAAGSIPTEEATTSSVESSTDSSAEPESTASAQANGAHARSGPAEFAAIATETASPEPVLPQSGSAGTDSSEHAEQAASFPVNHHG